MSVSKLFASAFRRSMPLEKASQARRAHGHHLNLSQPTGSCANAGAAISSATRARELRTMALSYATALMTSDALIMAIAGRTADFKPRSETTCLVIDDLTTCLGPISTRTCAEVAPFLTSTISLDLIADTQSSLEAYFSASLELLSPWHPTWRKL
jgi:hypothetical protein